MASIIGEIVGGVLDLANKYIADPAERDKFALDMATLQAQSEQAAAATEELDRDSARQREVGTKDKVNRNLAYIIIGSFITMVIATLAGYSKVDSALAGTLIGYLSAKAEQVISYYFGSTHSSSQKNDIITGMMKK